jgi:transcriptional regulator with XRE-family HTH domain
MAKRTPLSAEWYRRQINRCGDLDFTAGPAPESKAQTSVTVAFGTLVRLQRRSKGLSVVDFAKILDIEDDELRRIEHDSSYSARPRTITSIAKQFGVPTVELMKLAGAAVSNDPYFQEKALKFAAHSDDIGILSLEEREMLQSFVQFLRDKP